MKHILLLVFWSSAWLLSGPAVPAWAGQDVHTLFSGTQHPLTVHYLQGKEPGPTILIQGGIQGDEPAGFLTAQVLACSTVTKGNLVVIPRANVPSILKHRRQINVDLNRRFDKDYGEFYEDRLARAIKVLLKGCDAFIHLHEGSGFYHPTYVDQQRNPFRFGQSVIIDTAVFQDRIDLARLVDSVLSQINGQISPADYSFQLFNMNTLSDGTSYPEQRKSLTYFALNELGIPALAIEVSKSITRLSWKVRQQVLVTSLFLAAFGVEIELPGDLDPEGCYTGDSAVLTVNGRTLRLDRDASLVPDRDFLELSVAAVPAMARWDPAWGVYSEHRPQTNLLTGVSHVSGQTGLLSVVADGNEIGRVEVGPSRTVPVPDTVTRPTFLCLVNGEPRLLAAGEELDLIHGDSLVLEQVWGSDRDEIINLKGYVSNRVNNDGQDAGHEIIMEKGAFIQRYLLPSKARGVWRCEVVRETPGSPEHRFTIRVSPRRVEALLLDRDDDHGGMVLPVSPDGERELLTLPAGRYTASDIFSNGPKESVQMMVGDRPLKWGGAFRLEQGKRQKIELYDANTFLPLARLTMTGQE